MSAESYRPLPRGKRGSPKQLPAGRGCRQDGYSRWIPSAHSRRTPTKLIRYVFAAAQDCEGGGIPFLHDREPRADVIAGPDYSVRQLDAVSGSAYVGAFGSDGHVRVKIQLDGAAGVKTACTPIAS